jgi:hypothetical protein
LSGNLCRFACSHVRPADIRNRIFAIVRVCQVQKTDKW